MDPSTPITLAVAVYPNRGAAVEDYDAVRTAKTAGEYDHLAISVLTKRADGHVQVERHDSSAKHLGWGGALVGASLIVLAPAAAPVAMATSLGVGGGVSAAGLAGAGGLAGHFWHNIPKNKIREMSDVLETGESGLVIVAVNKLGSEIEPLLSHADKVVIDDTVKGDLDAVYDQAIQEAGAGD